MLVYIYPNGKCVKYDDRKRNSKYMEVPDLDLVAWDAWGREEAMIEQRRRSKEI
jgi:hypothetical protein